MSALLQALLPLNAHTLGVLQYLSWATMTVWNKDVRCVQKMQYNLEMCDQKVYLLLIVPLLSVDSDSIKNIWNI